VKSIMPSAVIYESASLEDDVEIGHNVVVLSGSRPEQVTSVRQGAIVGANSTIYEGVTIGIRAQVLPGSVVKQSVPPLAMVEGNPAAIIGYIDTPSNARKQAQRPVNSREVESAVRGVKIYNFSDIHDMRGNLSVGEFERQIPFQPKRYFVVYGVPTAETRGEHAHVNCHQFLIAVNGSINVIADDGKVREEFVLDRKNVGLYLPPMTWGIQYKYSRDAILLAFASAFYDPGDYIREYDVFIRRANSAYP